RRYPRVADHHGASLAIHWPGGLQHQIAQLARQQHATSFMVVQAALAALLSQLGRTPDVTVGIPVAGRTHPAVDQLVGMFVNTVVLRVQVDGDPTFAQLLSQV
ncbi:hypothetical protein F0Q45_27090, partial [Mycobacterium simiae]